MIYHIKTKTQTKSAYDFLKSEPLIGADTETTGLDPYLNEALLVQLGTPDDQFVFDMYHLEQDSRQLIFDILQAPKITKIFQNGKFDYKMLKVNYGVKVANLADTMITEQLLTKGTKKKGFGLGELVEKYRAGSMNKEIRSNFIDKELGYEFSEEEIAYAANDVKVLTKIYLEQLEVAKGYDGMLDLINLENNTVRVMAEMECNGIYPDQAAWISLEGSALIGKAAALAAVIPYFEPYHLKDLFGNLDINFDSPTQVKPTLEKIVGHTLKSTDAKYLAHVDHPVITALLEYREWGKKISTYGRCFLDSVHEVTNRIHAKYLQLGTDSGRSSCTAPNMQNIPKLEAYRTPFRAELPNWKMISADFANQELRVLAELSKEPAFIKCIEDGLDLHKMVGSILLNKRYEDITDAERSRAKTLNFGTVYGMSAYGLAKTLKIDKDEAKELLKKFFEAFPNIYSFLKQCEREVAQTKIAVSTLDGRIRNLANMDWDDWRKRSHALNIAKNHPIQGASASITKLALVNLQDKINEDNLEAKIVAVIHDEILVECHEDIAQKVATIVTDCMVEAFNFYCPNVTMTVDAIIDNHWVH